uniref:Uncharacterized protein n=1 Tax=Panagrolaimus superbus TaxID=310955 RepID=A0A914YNW2_9BILA
MSDKDIVNDVKGSTFTAAVDFKYANNTVGGSAFQNAGIKKNTGKNSSLKDDSRDYSSPSSDEDDLINKHNQTVPSSCSESEEDTNEKDKDGEKSNENSSENDGDKNKISDDDDSMNGNAKNLKDVDSSDEELAELDNTILTDFDDNNPQKTSNKVGIIAENAHNLIGYGAAKKLFRLVAANPILFFGVIPMVFPEAGVIVAFLLQDVMKAYKLKKKRMLFPK